MGKVKMLTGHKPERLQIEQSISQLLIMQEAMIKLVNESMHLHPERNNRLDSKLKVNLGKEMNG